ncbi:hypothetical protein [Streptomyces sp. V4I23]|uniref:hypothetical protein n=1 Tax=Streptomyces sp. V4I23 TaxID=3042282 RepID=UPI0027D8A29C|nr:hypothetical protein [Streptomyces sp. V4I23]
MIFNDEWAQLKSDAHERQSAQMRLNTVGAHAGGTGAEGNADLVVHQDDLGLVGNEAFRIHGELQKKADITGAGMGKDGSGSTAQAAAELQARNLAAGGELLSTLEIWSSKVKTVLQMYAHISNHLDFSKRLHANDEAEIAASLRHRDGSAVSVSDISKYVK